MLGAGAGAAIGARTSGAKGAAIGGVAGGLAGLIGGKAIDAMTADNREEYAAAQVRAARVQMMNDLNESEATNGGNGAQNGEAPKKTVKMVYPPGMYDGVYYGPREVEVPATN